MSAKKCVTGKTFILFRLTGPVVIPSKTREPKFTSPPSDNASIYAVSVLIALKNNLHKKAEGIPKLRAQPCKRYCHVHSVMFIHHA